MKTLTATPEPPPRNERRWPTNTTTSTATTGRWIVLDRKA